MIGVGAEPDSAAVEIDVEIADGQRRLDHGAVLGIEVAVENRVATVALVPTAAPLVIKALKEGPRDRKKTKNVKHNGNLKIDEIIDIAKKIRPRSYATEFKGTVKEILGTCVSIGCTVDGKSPKEVQALIESGEIEINQ